jgi:hypothetical protein
MRMAKTTVRGMGFLAAGRPATNGGGFDSSAATGRTYGVYIDGAGPAVVDGGAVSGELFTAPQTAAKSRAAAVRSTRSSRLRHRGHQEGSPASRHPQFGHWSTAVFRAARPPN